MMKSEELPETMKGLYAALGLGGHNLPRSVECLTLEEVRVFVLAHVERLLQDKPGLLMSILYRIDVPEHRVRDVFESAPYNRLAIRLTDLMIDRELRKVRTRRGSRHTEDR